jgi:tetratricopeptide (TPR) repeat protein
MARKGKFNEAIRHFSEVLRFQPDHSDAHGYLGSVLLAGGMLNKAMVHLSEAVRLDPNYADAHYNIGQIMLRQKQYDAAVLHLSHTVRLKPDDAQAHYQLSLALVQQKQAGEALRHYTKAVTLKPEVDTSPLLHHLMATSYAEARRFGEAALSEEKALELARVAGYQKLAQEFTKRLEIYKQLANSSTK